MLFYLDFILLSEWKPSWFEDLEISDADTILEKLKEAGHTRDSIFNIRNRQEMMKKKQLPHLGPWLETTTNFEFQEKNPETTFQQVIDVEKHLKVSGVGCKKFKCKDAVKKVGRTYDNLVGKARRIRYL